MPYDWSKRQCRLRRDLQLVQWAILALVIVVGLAGFCWSLGCATRADDGVAATGGVAANVSPAATIVASQPTSSPVQTGAVNTAIDADATANGNTGVNYVSTLPIGMVVLIAWMGWLSHRREMARIKSTPTRRAGAGA